MRRFDSVEEFASLEAGDLRRLAVDASGLAIAATGTDERPALDEALRKVELGQDDSDAATAMNALASRLDQDAWTAQEAGDEARYDSLFRQARAAAILAFALNGQPDEAIYEAAHAVGSAEEVARSTPVLDRGQSPAPAFRDDARAAVAVAGRTYRWGRG